MSSLAAHLQASGTIRSARFCKVSGDFTVAECDAGEKVIGVSQVGSKTAPIPSVTTPVAAESGDSLQLHGPGALCNLTLGGTVTAGDWLMSDADGKGVLATDGNFYGAQALQGGATGQEVLVQVQLGYLENT
jgi:hypothetical protein